ncbi:MAG: methyltransferase domain-containing protein [Pseudomonadota bacterium]
MSGDFSVDWLTLRTPADDRARSTRLIETCAARLACRAKDGPLTIADLGAGTGATWRALSPHLPRPQAWTLIDADTTLLDEAARRAEAAGNPDITVDTMTADLMADPTPWRETPDLVTASALFDLTSRAFIEDFAAKLGAARIPLLAMLTYDGRLELTPTHPDDAMMIDAFNTHQRSEKSFGRAAGPDGAGILAEALAANGARVEVDDTPWLLESDRGEALMAATLEGWADAARAILPGDGPRVDRWLAARLADTRTLVVGHKDIFADYS